MEPFQPYHNAGSQLVNPLTLRVHVCFGTNVTGQPDVIFPDKIQGLCEWIAEVVSCFEAVKLRLGACYAAAVIATVAVLLVRGDV